MGKPIRIAISATFFAFAGLFAAYAILIASRATDTNDAPSWVFLVLAAGAVAGAVALTAAGVLLARTARRGDA